MGADGDAGADPEDALPVPAAQPPLHLIKKGEDMAGISIQSLAAGGRADPPSQPFKKPDAVVLFQLLDSKAHRWLRQVQLLCGPGNIAEPVNRLKNPKMAQCHRTSYI